MSVFKTDRELNDMLEARGWLTMDQQLKGSALGGFMAHAAVTTPEKLAEWVKLKHQECVRFKALYDLEIWTNKENEEYHLGKLTMISELVANMKKVGLL